MKPGGGSDPLTGNDSGKNPECSPQLYIGSQASSAAAIERALQGALFFHVL